MLWAQGSHRKIATVFMYLSRFWDRAATRLVCREGLDNFKSGNLHSAAARPVELCEYLGSNGRACNRNQLRPWPEQIDALMLAVLPAAPSLAAKGSRTDHDRHANRENDDKVRDQLLGRHPEYSLKVRAPQIRPALAVWNMVALKHIKRTILKRQIRRGEARLRQSEQRRPVLPIQTPASPHPRRTIHQAALSR